MNFRMLLMTLLANLRGQLLEIYPRWDNEDADSSTQATQLHRDLAPVLRDFFESVRLALASAEVASRESAAWLGNAIYTMAERQRRSAEVEATGRQQFDAFTGRAVTALDEAVRLVRAAGVPARPGPADATQEGALANLRTDLRMVLDRVPAADVAARLAKMAGVAALNRDQLRLWLLVGSTWPQDYLESRGQDQMGPWLTQQTAVEVLPAASRAMGQALTTLPLLEMGSETARRVVETYLPSVLMQELDDLADQRQRAASLAGAA